MRKFIFLFIIGLSFNLFAVDTLKIKTNNLKDIVKVIVVKPSQKTRLTTGRAALFLLHGWSGAFDDWYNNTKPADKSVKNLQEYADLYDMVIICPDGLYKSWYVNSPAIKTQKYEDFFFNDLYKMIISDKSLNIAPGRVYITGLSMGGHGALTFYIKHPNLFRAGASMSGILDMSAFANNWGIPEIFGKQKNNSDLKKFSAVGLLQANSNNDLIMFIDCGTEDFACKVNTAFDSLLKTKGIEFKSRFVSGNHNWDYWLASLPLHLNFFRNIEISDRISKNYF